MAPGKHILDNGIRYFALFFEHFENLILEDFFWQEGQKTLNNVGKSVQLERRQQILEALHSVVFDRNDFPLESILEKFKQVVEIVLPSLNPKKTADI